MSLARPAPGARSIAAIAAPDARAVLRPIEARGNIETAEKRPDAIGQVLRFAIAIGRAESDPTGVLKGALASLVLTHRAAIANPVASWRIAARNRGIRERSRNKSRA